jgi:hypothetical protein
VGLPEDIAIERANDTHRSHPAHGDDPSAEGPLPNAGTRSQDANEMQEGAHPITMTTSAHFRRDRTSGRRLALVASNQVALCMPLAASHLRALELRDRLHLDDLAAGRATGAAVNELRRAAMLSARLAALGFGADVDAAAAEVALAHADHGVVAAEHVAVVARMLDHLAAQRTAAPRGRVMQALGLVGWR